MMLTKHESTKMRTKFVGIRLESIKDTVNTVKMVNTHVAGIMNIVDILTMPALCNFFGNYGQKLLGCWKFQKRNRWVCCPIMAVEWWFVSCWLLEYAVRYWDRIFRLCGHWIGLCHVNDRWLDSNGWEINSRTLDCDQIDYINYF